LARTQPTSDTLRPWQFFTLVALFSATVAVFLVRGSSPASMILLCLGIFAAALVSLAALRTLRPLAGGDIREPEMIGGHTRAAIEREKNLVLRSIKELEFDRAMGKVAPADYEDMVARLRTRAVRLLKQVDSAGSGYREIIERELAARLGKAGAIGLVEDLSEQRAESRGQDALSGARDEGQGATAPVAALGECAACATPNDPDARFCKQCGTKLLATAIAVLIRCSFFVLLFSMPALAQFQMPDPKEMSGIPRPVSDLEDGHISVRLIRGQLSSNVTDHPVDLFAGDRKQTVRTDENGRAEFSGIPAGARVKAVAIVEGERLESQEFPAPGKGGIRLMLVATPKGGAAPPPVFQPQSGTVTFGDQTRVIIDVADDALQVYYVLDIQNGAAAHVNPLQPIILEMPRGAQSTTILGDTPQATAMPDHVTITGPFAPGQTSVQVAYHFPISDGDLTLSQTLPLAVPNLAVLMRKIDDMALTSPQLPANEEREFQGERYVLAQGPGLAPGSTLTLNISGLPHHSPVPRRIALALVAIIGGAFAWAAVRVPPQGADASRAKQLASRRERIFNELVRLEQQRRAGSVDAARYAERRPALIAQLERVYRDLDAEGGHGLAA
jgi:hypothetical protein